GAARVLDSSPPLRSSGLWVQAAGRTGASVRFLELAPATGELRLDELDTVITERTRLVAITAASNLIGTIPPVRRIADAAHAVGADRKSTRLNSRHVKTSS